MKKWQFVTLIGVALLVVGAYVGLNREPDEARVEVAMASLDMMPQAVKRAPKVVREAYQFAVANPEVLTQIPCYCGCGGMGHTSNYSCFVGVMDDGSRQFDGHALGCSICVDIAQDAMRLTKRGASVPAVRLTVDATYSRYGPSNM
ncbi:MAG: hypothetical protein GWN32_05915 [Gemmatimonadetes bacterium]|nr:hypothetical protein [Gemmatimonadota bacterium]